MNKTPYIKPEQRFNHNGTDLHYYDSTESYLEQLTVEGLAKVSGDWRKEYVRINGDESDYVKQWAGGVTHKEAKETALTGMTVDKEALELRDEFATHLKEVQEQDFTWDVAGEEVDIGAFMTGEPECMLTTQEAAVQKKNNITLIYNISASAGVSVDQMRWRGIAVMALVDALQEKYNVTLYLANGFGGSFGEGKAKGAAVVKIVDPSRNYDPQLVAFTLIHPAMFRRLAFWYINLLDPNTARKWGVDNFGYGTPGTVATLPTEVDDSETMNTPRIYYGDKAFKSIFSKESAFAWIQQQIININNKVKA